MQNNQSRTNVSLEIAAQRKENAGKCVTFAWMKMSEFQLYLFICVKLRTGAGGRGVKSFAASQSKKTAMTSKNQIDPVMRKNEPRPFFLKHPNEHHMWLSALIRPVWAL